MRAALRGPPYTRQGLRLSFRPMHDSDMTAHRNPPTSSTIARWLAQAQAEARRPPTAPREPLWLEGAEIGSVETGFCARLPQPQLAVRRLRMERRDDGWHLQGIGSSVGSGSELLNRLAALMREHGLCGPWRDEQLAVHDAQGLRVATIERGAVRPLAIATHAVHLIGLTPDGRMWVQQRALDKPTYPGKLDTLMGGMVSAADTLPHAVERETWEEAGLRLDQLRPLRHGGCLEFSCPSEDEGHGFMRERIDWFVATVPDHLRPTNQDGEVQSFELLDRPQLAHRLVDNRFTPEAGLLLASYLGWQ